MSAAPELVAITLLPIRIAVQVVAAIGHLFAGGRLDPTLSNQLLPLPLTLLQIQLTKLGNILGLDT